MDKPYKHYQVYMDLGMFHGIDLDDVQVPIEEYIGQCLMDALCRGMPPLKIEEIGICPDQDDRDCGADDEC